MGRLTYIIISFLMLNIFAVYDYNAETVQLVCRQNTLSYFNSVKILQIAEIEDEGELEFLCLEINLDQENKLFPIEETYIPRIRKSCKSFILFEADASPPLLS